MSELISGKEALVALANGEDVEFNHGSQGWVNCLGLNVEQILGSMFSLRLKPHTITLNGIEVPAPFKPKSGDMVWIIDDSKTCGYRIYEYDLEGDSDSVFFGLWRTEDEIKQVVAALRTIFK